MSHVCLGFDQERGIPCDACAVADAWARYEELDALADEREAREGRVVNASSRGEGDMTSNRANGGPNE